MTKVDRILIKFPRDVQVDLRACGRVVIRLHLEVDKGMEQNNYKRIIYTQTIFSKNIFYHFLICVYHFINTMHCNLFILLQRTEEEVGKKLRYFFPDLWTRLFSLMICEGIDVWEQHK